MVTRAMLRYVRISPRKFRLIIPIVKGKNPEAAIMTLSTVKKGASKMAIDLLRSAIANAKRMQGVDVADLYISRFVANCGPQLKRFRAASMGRASHIRKRTSHIILELDRIPVSNKQAQSDAAVSHEKGTPKKVVAPKAAEKTAAVKHDRTKKPAAKAAKTDNGKKGKE